MFYVDNNSGISGMPPLSPPQSNTPTWFTEGDKHKGISYIGQDWLNIIQAELLNILAEAGIVPDKGKLNQLTLAVKTIIAHNAYIQANHLREIADAGADAQAAAREHLGLGALSSKDDLSAADVGALAIAQNGADVENPPLFVKNLGLQETVDRAANAVQKTGDSMSGQLKISGVDALRIYDASYGMIFRRSENAFHMIPTEANLGENGPISPVLRPLSIDLNNGWVTIGNNATVNGVFYTHGEVEVDGNICMKNDARQHFYMVNADGSIRMWLWKDKGGDGVCINNGADGGDNFIFHKDGGFRSPGPVYAGISGNWPGAGAYAWQWDTVAPFSVPLISRPNTDNTYFPLVKGKVILSSGFPVAGSLGLETLGRDGFPDIVIHAKTDNPAYDRVWRFSTGEGAFYSPGRVYANDRVHCGSACLAPNGDVWGTLWSNNWLSTHLYNQFLARDNNINGRATWGWVLQNFVQDIRYSAATHYWPGGNEISWTFFAPGASVLVGIDVQETGSNSADNIGGVYYKTLQKCVNNTWYNAWTL